MTVGIKTGVGAVHDSWRSPAVVCSAASLLLPARERRQQRIGYLEQRLNSRAGAPVLRRPRRGRPRQVRQPAKVRVKSSWCSSHKLKQFIGQRLVAIRQLSQPQLAGEALAVLPGELTGESIDRRLGQGHRLITGPDAVPAAGPGPGAARFQWVMAGWLP